VSVKPSPIEAKAHSLFENEDMPGLKAFIAAIVIDRFIPVTFCVLLVVNVPTKEPFLYPFKDVLDVLLPQKKPKELAVETDNLPLTYEYWSCNVPKPV
jgi:hypothetical protein